MNSTGKRVRGPGRNVGHSICMKAASALNTQRTPRQPVAKRLLCSHRGARAWLRQKSAGAADSKSTSARRRKVTRRAISSVFPHTVHALSLWHEFLQQRSSMCALGWMLQLATTPRHG